MKQRAILTGNFDPIHFGHLDLIKTILNLFPEIILGIHEEIEYYSPFSPEDRLKLVQETLQEHLPIQEEDRVHPILFSGSERQLVHQFGSACLIKTLIDKDYSELYSFVDRNSTLEYIILAPNPDFAWIKSKDIRNYFVNNEDWDIHHMIPESLVKKIKVHLK